MSGVLVLAAVTIATYLFVRSWRATNARLDHDLPLLLTDAAQWCHDFGHNYRPEHGTTYLICQQCGTSQDRCQIYGHDWRRYADYRICISCGVRSDSARKAS